MGRAVAEVLARDGAKVTIAARTRAKRWNRRRRSSPPPAAPRSIFVVADLMTDEGRQAALAACPEPDILINNGDGEPPGDYRDYSRADWIRALDRMMLSPIEMMRLTVDGMIARGFGGWVNIVSRSVKDAATGNGALQRRPLRARGLRRRPVAADGEAQRHHQQHPARHHRLGCTASSCPEPRRDDRASVR